MIDLELLDARRRLRGRRVTEKWPVRYRESLEPNHDFDLILGLDPVVGLTELYGAFPG